MHHTSTGTLSTRWAKTLGRASGWLGKLGLWEIGRVIFTEQQLEGLELFPVAGRDVDLDFNFGDADVVAGPIEGSLEGGANLIWREGFECEGDSVMSGVG